jgi:lactoylglutathione lyase
MKFTFNHFNFNVLNLEKSLRFYEEALALSVKRTKEASDGRFILTFLEDRESSFTLELTWLRDRTEVYDLGEEEYHLAFKVDDFEAAHAHHEKMGVICYENKDMGIYFIQDPDGYWIEIIPTR